jgi:hypothetical protein
MTDTPKDELFGDGSEEPKGPRSILTPKEIEAAKAIARERVEKSLKEAETERLIAAEMEKMRREEGARTGKVDLDEEVSVTIDLAEFADRLRINNVEYFHGHTYTVPRHVFDTMRDIMFRGHLHQNALDGKDLNTFYRSKAQPVLSGKVGA